MTKKEKTPYEKDLLKKVGELYWALLHKEDMTSKEHSVLTKLGDCLDILNGERR